MRRPATSKQGVRAEELPGWLAVLGVDEATRTGVRVGEEAERSWCLRPVEGDPDADHDADHDDGPAWEVFWTEQGGRYEWVRFADEATACFALFGRLVWAHAVRVDAARGRGSTT